MSEQDRLTRVEAEVGFLKSAFSKIESAITQLAQDMRQLAVSETERAADRETIKRLFTTLDEHGERLAQIEGARKDEQISRLREELAIKRRWIGEVGKTVLAVFGALIAYHYGVHPL